MSPDQDKSRNCASGRFCRNPNHVLTNNHKCFRCDKPLGVECAAVNAEDIPFDQFGDGANQYPWEKRDIVICFLCLTKGETPNRLGRTLLPDGIQQQPDAPVVLPNQKHPPTGAVLPNPKQPPQVSCGRRGCKTGGIAIQCAFPTCLAYRCVPCNFNFFKKREWPILHDDVSGDVIVACSKKHYGAVLKNLQPNSSRIPWNNDGPKGYDDPVNSESLLIEWLSTEGNYTKFRGSDNGGKTKISFCQDIANMLQRRGARAQRTPKQVLDKIVSIEKRFRETYDFEYTDTGQGLKRKGDGTFEEVMLKKFRYYFDLTPIMADRASAQPSVTSDERNNGHGYLSEEAEGEDEGQNNSQTTSLLDEEDDDIYDDEYTNEDQNVPLDLLDHSDVEQGNGQKDAVQTVVDTTPQRDNTDSGRVGQRPASSNVSVVKKRKGVAASSSKKPRKKRSGNLKIDQSLLMDSDEETSGGERQTKLALKGRLKEAEMEEQKRHNLEMETIQRENNKWENKQKELAYKQQLWKQFKELQDSGLDDAQIVSIFPDMADFIKKNN